MLAATVIIVALSTTMTALVVVTTVHGVVAVAVTHTLPDTDVDVAVTVTVTVVTTAFVAVAVHVACLTLEQSGVQRRERVAAVAGVTVAELARVAEAERVQLAGDGDDGGVTLAR
jgi:hypothetical protein